MIDIDVCVHVSVSLCVFYAKNETNFFHAVCVSDGMYVVNLDNVCVHSVYYVHELSTCNTKLSFTACFALLFLEILIVFFVVIA